MHRTRRRHATTLCVTATALVALTACADSSTPQASPSNGNDQASSCPESITVGSTVDATSYLKSLDSKVRAGIEAAVEQVNADGGVLDGTKLELAVEDMGADPKRQVTAFQKITSQAKPVAFLNGFSSAGNAAVAPMAASASLPMIVASVVPADSPDFVFSTIVPTTFETAVRSSYLAEQGLKKVAVLADPTPYSKLSLSALEEQVKKLGIELTSVQEHATDVVDLRPQVAKILADKPDAIINIGAGPQQIVAAKALADAGSDIPLLIGTDSDANVKQADDAYPNVIFVASDPRVYDALPEDKRSESLNALHEKFAGESELTYIARGFDAGNLLVQAIETAGSCDGADIQKALIDMDAYDGGTAVYDYTADDHYGMATNPLHLATLEDDGKTTIVFSAAP